MGSSCLCKKELQNLTAGCRKKQIYCKIIIKTSADLEYILQFSEATGRLV
jgi:hypothetical protein